ncbi:MAG: hypothetical protein QNJ62_06550 [Methyloceanibacter sp.]|nr:hypothetical protein [Methyloceanibacter sp.]
MPFAGGLYDQPAILEHAVTVIRDEEARIAAEHAKRQKNKPW